MANEHKSLAGVLGVSDRRRQQPGRIRIGVCRGRADAVLAARQAVLDAAYAAHPERFVRQPPEPLKLPSEVWIKPPADGPRPATLELPRCTDFDQQLSQTG